VYCSRLRFCCSPEDEDDGGRNHPINPPDPPPTPEEEEGTFFDQTWHISLVSSDWKWRIEHRTGTSFDCSETFFVSKKLFKTFTKYSVLRVRFDEFNSLSRPKVASKSRIVSFKTEI
jgi:hypothetical protein